MSNETATNSITMNSEKCELVITRTFGAPRELVFKAWTEAKHLKHWWGPKGFTITVQEINVKPGGVWTYVMHGPNGVDYNNKIDFIEVVSPERLVYSHGDGKEEHFRVTVTFADQGNKTELTMRMLFKSAEELDKAVQEYGAIEGAKSTLDRLEEELAKV